MRKSNLTKAMACLMAATMAVTCVPGVNVPEITSVTAEAAEISQEVLNAKTYELTFDNEEVPEGCKIQGSGKIEKVEGDEAHPYVFHNSAGEKGIRKNYMRLPKNTLADAVKVKNELTISMDVKLAEGETGYINRTLLSAYGSKPDANNTNTWPMMVIYARKLLQVNDGEGHWTDFTDLENVNGTNLLDTLWLDDKAWHTVTVTYTKTKTVFYIDGNIVNEWDITGGLDGFLSEEGASKLKYICLGGNQPWNFSLPVDEDAEFLFDNVAFYSSALTQEQVLEITPSTTCKSLSLAEEYKGTKWDEDAAKRNLKCSALTVPFKVGVEMTEEEENKPISDKVEAFIITTGAAVAIEGAESPEAAFAELAKQESISQAATAAAPVKDGKTATVTITPNALTEGAAVAIKCGDKAKPVVYYFKTVKDFCESLTSDKNGFVANAGQPAVFTVTAKAASSGAVMTGYEIKPATGTAITGVADMVEGSDTKDSKKGERSTSFIADIKEGENVFAFTCGEGELQKILTVTVTGRASSQGSSSGNTTSTPDDDTQTPGTTTDSAIDPSQTTDSAIDPSQPTDDAINTTPDDSKPDDAQTPNDNQTSDDTQTPGNTDTDNDDNNTGNDNNSSKQKTTKKKAKVVSVTAKKGKKTVSGTVKISSSGKKVSKAAVKVYVNGKKKATAKTKSSGKFSAKLSKKLKKGDKVKLVITKSSIKKITKIVRVK